MSPASGLELDFGFSSLLDGTGNPSAYASSLGDFGTSSSSGNGAAADYLSLSNLFDSSGSGAAPSTASHAGAPSSAAWQTKKTLLDQQQQQLQENSLNALLSQHGSNATTNSAPVPASAPVAASGVSSGTGTTPNPFGFATREELEALATSANASATQTTANAQAAAAAAAAGLPNNGSNNYMFVATIVDPNQEDAPPQQMLFLPGSNQVIPMPSSVGGSGTIPMMSLANLPVVFPQGTGATTAPTMPSTRDPTANAFALSLPSAAEVTGSTNWQQQGLRTPFPSGLGNLDDVFSSQTVPTLAPAPPLEYASQGQLQPVVAAAPPAAPASKAAMPVRPLSAYNFFFSDERERILQNKTDENDVFDNAKKQRLLLAHLAKDRSKRRPHRKTHGKINFTTLSKLIGQRWKQLPDERKNFYREVAAIDLERYQRELRERSPSNANGDF